MPTKMKRSSLLVFILFLLFTGLKLNAQNDYFTPLSQSKINANLKNVNTNGVIRAVEDVPNTRKSKDLSVSDPHNLLSNNAESIIETTLDDLHADKDYEIMVVCLNSIGGQDPRFWGTDLFNYWKIGDRETENGLLILLVKEARRVEFITGRGMESVLTDAEGYDIQQEQMVPYFKKSDYVTGMVRGVQAVDNLLRGKQVLYDSNSADTGYSNDYLDSYKAPPFYLHPLFLGYAAFCGVLTLIYFIFLVFAYMTKDLYKRYKIMRFWSLLIFAFITPIPFIILVIFTRNSMTRWRNMERVGLKSGDLLHKLSEEEEDQYLTKGQITEEIVQSVDYDVWTNDAGTDIQVFAFRKWFSPYSKCAKCGYRTWFKVYDKTVRVATYSRSGKGEKKYQCKNCGHQTIQQYRIPKKQRTRSGGGYYSGGGSFGGGGGFSGGSFGGGSSGAGGSGSSW